MWLGSQYGHISNSNYNFYAFAWKVWVTIAVNGDSNGNSNGGIIFRAKSVSSTNDGGQSYYVGLKPGYNTIVAAQWMMDGQNLANII